MGRTVEATAERFVMGEVVTAITVGREVAPHLAHVREHGLRGGPGRPPARLPGALGPEWPNWCLRHTAPRPAHEVDSTSVSVGNSSDSELGPGR